MPPSLALTLTLTLIVRRACMQTSLTLTLTLTLIVRRACMQPSLPMVQQPCIDAPPVENVTAIGETANLVLLTLELVCSRCLEGAEADDARILRELRLQCCVYAENVGAALERIRVHQSLH